MSTWSIFPSNKNNWPVHVGSICQKAELQELQGRTRQLRSPETQSSSFRVRPWNSLHDLVVHGVGVVRVAGGAAGAHLERIKWRWASDR